MVLLAGFLKLMWMYLTHQHLRPKTNTHFIRVTIVVVYMNDLPGTSALNYIAKKCMYT